MPIALIEIEESELERLKIPFLLYGVYQKNASAELKAAFLEMAQLRKDMAKQHQLIEDLQESEHE